MEANRIVAQHYKIVKPLFQITSYLYVQLCSLKTYQVVNAALYLYQNEDPSQSLKMLAQKLDLQGQNTQSANLIFPYKHLKEELGQKKLSVFFFKDYLVPMNHFQKKSFSTLQILQILHGALNCLSQLHTRQIIHGNVSLQTCYLLQNRNSPRCRFSLNILDSSYFVGDNCISELEELLFKSEGQSLGLGASYKDDLQSLVYVMTHLVSKGKLFTVQRFQLQWVTENEFSRWKTCDYFKQMVKIIPPKLHILIQIYTMSKSLRKNQLPDYMKLIKKVLELILTHRKIQGKIPDKPTPSIVIKKKACEFDVLDESSIEIKFKKSNFSVLRNRNDENKQLVRNVGNR